MSFPKICLDSNMKDCYMLNLVSCICTPETIQTNLWNIFTITIYNLAGMIILEYSTTELWKQREQEKRYLALLWNKFSLPGTTALVLLEMKDWLYSTPFIIFPTSWDPFGTSKHCAFPVSYSRNHNPFTFFVCLF